MVSRRPEVYLPCLYEGLLSNLSANNPSNVDFLSWLAANGYEVYEGEISTNVFPRGLEFAYRFSGKQGAAAPSVVDVTLTKEPDNLYYVTDVGISEHTLVPTP